MIISVFDVNLPFIHFCKHYSYCSQTRLTSTWACKRQSNTIGLVRNGIYEKMCLQTLHCNTMVKLFFFCLFLIYFLSLFQFTPFKFLFYTCFFQFYSLILIALSYSTLSILHCIILIYYHCIYLLHLFYTVFFTLSTMNKSPVNFVFLRFRRISSKLHYTSS